MEKLRRVSTSDIVEKSPEGSLNRVMQSCSRRLGEQVSKRTLSQFREILEEENRRSGFAEESCETPPTVRSGKVAHGLYLSVQGRSLGVIGIWLIEISEFPWSETLVE
jgi:hypothetical protein